MDYATERRRTMKERVDRKVIVGEGVTSRHSIIDSAIDV